MYKFVILYSEHNQPTGIYERADGIVHAKDFAGALDRVLKYYNNYTITSIKLVAIDDIIDVMDIKEL